MAEHRRSRGPAAIDRHGAGEAGGRRGDRQQRDPVIACEGVGRTVGVDDDRVQSVGRLALFRLITSPPAPASIIRLVLLLNSMGSKLSTVIRRRPGRGSGPVRS